MVDADKGFSTDSVFFLDGIQLGFKNVVFFRKLDNALFQDHVIETTLFTRPFSSFIVSSPTVPVSVILFAIRNKFPLFSLSKEFFAFVEIEVARVVRVVPGRTIVGRRWLKGEVWRDGEACAWWWRASGWCGCGAQGSASPGAQQLLLAQNKLGDHVSADNTGSARIFTVVKNICGINVLLFRNYPNWGYNVIIHIKQQFTILSVSKFTIILLQ